MGETRRVTDSVSSLAALNAWGLNLAVRCILRLTNSLYPQHDIHLLVDAVYLKHPALTRLHMQTSDSWSAAAEICSECYRTAECTLQVSRHFFFFFFCADTWAENGLLYPQHTQLHPVNCVCSALTQNPAAVTRVWQYTNTESAGTHTYTHTSCLMDWRQNPAVGSLLV